MPARVTIRMRRGTTAEWSAVNPVLDAGELGVDVTTGTIRVGNGSTAWADLPSTGSGGGGDGNPEVFPASEVLAGIVELATAQETIDGVDSTRAVTPAGAAAAFQPLNEDLTALAWAQNSAVLAATTAVYTTDEESKLESIEIGAEVNDVYSVNSQTGDVVLTATSVGADPAGTAAAAVAAHEAAADPHPDYTTAAEAAAAAPVQSVNAKTGAVVLNAADVGADATGTASSAVSTHAALTSGVHGISAFGAQLIDDADAAAARTTLGLGTAATQASTAFQPADTELTAIAGLTSAADRLPYFTGAGTAALATFTSFGRNLVDDADAAAARTTLGLGTAATTASTAYAPSSHVGATGAAHGNASTSVAGFMSAADKTKLDGIAAGAQVNAVTSVNGQTGDVVVAAGLTLEMALAIF